MHESERLLRQIGLGQPRQQLARLRPGDIESTPGLGKTFEADAVGAFDHVEVTLMITFGDARTDHQEILVIQLGDREIAGNAAAQPDHRRQAGASCLGRYVVCDQAFEVIMSAFAANAVLGEVGNIDDADRFTQCAAFGRDRLEPVLPFETIGLYRLDTVRRVPQGVLVTIAEAENRAERLLFFVHRSCLDRPPGVALFIRKMNLEAV